MDNISGFNAGDGTPIQGSPQPSAPQTNNSQLSGFNAGDGSPISQNTQSGNVPIDVRDAQQVTGQHDLDGLCEQAVEQWAGLPKMGTTAGNAWNSWVEQGKAYSGLDGAEPGDLLYFQPNNSNQGAGHAALFEGYQNGQPIMISATYNGIREDNVSNWSSTVAPLLGYVHPGQ